jgi:hypothetical protein
MIDAHRAAELFTEAARLNLEDPLLRGSLLAFPNYGQLVMTGDIHGHRRNFDKLRKYCRLDQFGARHVVLHELIHRELESYLDRDDSHEVCLDAAAWKCEFPDQVHFLLSNHELAQITSQEITKNGRVVTIDYESAVRETYGAGAEKVLIAMYEFIRSFAVAGRTANRVFLSHTLPGPRELPLFDASILQRAPTQQDLSERGSAHSLFWGRYQTEPVLAALRETFDVDYFICGHQPQETGFDVLHGRMIILASDHNHGVFLPLDLNRPVTLDSLMGSIRPFAGVE